MYLGMGLLLEAADNAARRGEVLTPVAGIFGTRPLSRQLTYQSPGTHPCSGFWELSQDCMQKTCKHASNTQAQKEIEIGGRKYLTKGQMKDAS